MASLNHQFHDFIWDRDNILVSRKKWRIGLDQIRLGHQFYVYGFRIEVDGPLGKMVVGSKEKLEPGGRPSIEDRSDRVG